MNDSPTDDREAWVRFPCLAVSQPIGTFYVGVLPARTLIQLSRSDVRRIEGERREVESYLGIERPLDLGRVGEIKQYVTTLDASFPSSIIVAVRSQDSEYDADKRQLALRDEPNVAKILDGQHRLAGLQGYEGDTFQVVVTVFVDMDIENQAMLFAIINLQQTKVNKSLVYDLYDYAKGRSPQKTAHNIARLLNTEQGSPFEGKIKVLGTAGDPEETISQALFVDALLEYLSDDPVKDRDDLKRKRKLRLAERSEEMTLIFRNLFITERDGDIARTLWNYFGAVEDRWDVFWRVPSRGNVLNRTTGFRALMQFLRYAYLDVVKPGETPSREQFREVFSRIDLKGEDVTSEKYSPGTSGLTALRNDLLRQAGLQ